MIYKKILIVEDELGVAKALKRALELNPTNFYQVSICSSAEEALARLSEKNFDLLVSDFRLPGKDGLVLLEEARQINPEIVTIMITAYGSPELQTRIQAVANTYIPKPYHLRDIINAIQTLLPGNPTNEESLPPHQPASPVGKANGSPLERRRLTHIKVVATDLDGTLAINGKVPPLTWDLLRQLKASGMSLILDTGRVLESFINDGPYSELFEAIVAEDGAVIFFPRKNIFRQPFGRLSPVVIQRLEELNIPLERGMCIVATRTPHDRDIMKVLQELNIGATIEYNLGSVMLLPPGATKGTGLGFALHELGYSTHNVIACGDAENDHSLLSMAEIAVAVPNALPKIKDIADVILPPDPEDNGPGINQLLKQILTRRGPQHLQRPERRLVLGYYRDGSPVYLDPLNLVDNLIGIFGNSNSGKSWLSGLMVEELLRTGYQVCIIDPEGDYSALASSTHCLHIGASETPLPSIGDLITLIEWHDVSMVVDLSTKGPDERQEYLLGLMRALRGIRARRGRPHWTLIDEAQFFCPTDGGEMTDLILECLHEGLSIGLVSYTPSQLSPLLINRLDDLLLTRLNKPEEITALAPYLSKSPATCLVSEHLPELIVGEAILCSNTFKPLTIDLRSPVRFKVGPRSIPHIRHLQKYLRSPLPSYKRFYFCLPGGKNLGISAASMWEFRELLGAVQLDSLEYHQKRGDFEQWIQNVLGDTELAHKVHKLNGRQLEGSLLRESLCELVINRYDELENLM